MILERVQFGSELLRFQLRFNQLLLPDFLHSGILFQLYAHELVHSLLLLSSCMKYSLIVLLFLPLLVLSIYDLLVHGDQHVKHWLILILFIDLPWYF